MFELGYLSLGAFAGALGIWGWHRVKRGRFDLLASKILHQAEVEAGALKSKALIELEEKKYALSLEREKILFSQQKEQEKVKTKLSLLEKERETLAKRFQECEKIEKLAKEHKGALDALELGIHKRLEEISGYTKDQAKSELFVRMEYEIKGEAARLIARTQKELEEEKERLAQRILSSAIQKIAVPCVSEATVQTVTLPSEDLKGRIIGREGRNIRTLERLTGITLLLDETPGVVVLSGFDPMRMQVAKLALQDLINDGRIHPTKIEESVEKAKHKLNHQIKKFGEAAALRTGVFPLHPELITLLGKLKFRLSYGQNMLDHSIEVSFLMGAMAEELGLNVALSRKIGLLHDVGKALTHEVKGTHAMIGHDLALKYGESSDVANGIGCHHNEIAPTTIEGSLCGTADAISASRPGARIEAVEEYLKRLKFLEEIALSFEGVEKAYVLQAGREILVSVIPEKVDDDGVLILARELALRIEKELRYPGKIKVSVMREKRAVQYAI